MTIVINHRQKHRPVVLVTPQMIRVCIALRRILETVVTFHLSGGKVYSLNKYEYEMNNHTCMIKHTKHEQSVQCSIYLT